MEPELPSTPLRIVLAGASMRDIAAKATAITLKTANSPSPKVESQAQVKWTWPSPFSIVPIWTAR